MKISSVVIAALPLVVSSLGSGSFSYKPDSDKAPNAWGSLDLGPTVDNQCGGAAQSGIDVPVSSCDTTGDYVFAVRIIIACHALSNSLSRSSSLSFTYSLEHALSQTSNSRSTITPFSLPTTTKNLDAHCRA